MLADLPILWSLVRGRPKGADQAASLEAFYGPQAEAYDRFRERLLHGRAEAMSRLLERLPSTGGTLVELGAGTGRNLEFAGDRLERFDQVYAVDLCSSLLEVARRRFLVRGWSNVRTIEADATTWRPIGGADAVLCSYSLSMIPDWRGALANAMAMLRPGGVLAVVDFHRPEAGNWLDRQFWPWWFRHDGVHLRGELLQELRSGLMDLDLVEAHGPVPYLPVSAPFVMAVGRSPRDCARVA